MRRIALAKKGTHGIADIGIQAGGRLLKLFLVKLLVVPLTVRQALLRVQAAINQWQHVAQRKSFFQIRHTQVRYTVTALRMMAGHCPGHRTAPIMTDPNRLLATQVVEQFEHVGHTVF